MPPPINVSNIDDINVFKNAVKSCVNNPVLYKALSNGAIKITASDETDYRKIKNLLVEMKENHDEQTTKPNNKIEYHTYQLKSERWFRFVARGLPPDTIQDEIKKDIEKHGHVVASITNVIKTSTEDGEKRSHDIQYFILTSCQKRIIKMYTTSTR